MDGRIRLRQWLEGRLNSGYIPGLLWLDKSKAIFKIPWKHHSKHTWQEDDAAIFKDWAVVTGRFREGLDVPDWPMWKTRLRCALNKAPDIQEVRQHHNLHCDEPFKVYRFISKTESMWRANASRHASLIFDGVPCTGQGSAPVPGGGGTGNGGMPQFFSSGPTLSGGARIARGNCQHSSDLCTGGSCAGSHNNQHQKALLGGSLKCVPSKPVTLIQKTEEGLIKLKCINIPVLQHAPQSPQRNSSQNALGLGAPQSLRSSFPGCPTLQSLSPTCQLSPKRAAPGLGRRCKLELVRTDRDESGRLGRACTSTGPAGSISGVAVTLSQTGGSIDSSVANCGGHELHEVAALSAGQKIRLSDVMEPEMHQICLRIQHLDQRVSDMIVNNPNGCCIYFGRFDENLSTVGPEPIEPQIYQFVADCNRYCVDMLLDNMQRGVVLSIGSDGSIFAEKLCKCATFVYRPGTSGDFLFVDKLARRDKTMIFDFRTFLEQLHYFQRGLAERPHVELVLAFGQQIKERASPDSLYVWCRLASCKAWFLLQRAISNQSRPILGSCRRLCSQNPSGSYGVPGGTVGGVTARRISRSERIFITSDDGVLLRGQDDDPVEVTGTNATGDSMGAGDMIVPEQEGTPGDDVDEEGEEGGLEDQLMVYGDNCLSEELGLIGVAHEVSIENSAGPDEFPCPTIGHHHHHHHHERRQQLRHGHHGHNSNSSCSGNSGDGSDQDEHEQHRRHRTFRRHEARFEYADLSYQFDGGGGGAGGGGGGGGGGSCRDYEFK